MPAPDPRSATPTDCAGMVEALEAILRAQVQGHTRLLACIERKRTAIRSADIRAVESLCGEENAITPKICDLEKKRLDVIGRLTAALAPSAAAPLTVSEIAARLDQQKQERLLALAAQLREVLADVKKQSAIVRAAADALARHMGGIVQTVHSALSRAGVYGHRGRIILGAQVASSLDLKS